jgi:hypothetical protein
MAILQQNSTHKAVESGHEIDIYLKGFECGSMAYDDEYLYSIPMCSKDSILPLFEQIEENRRIIMAESLGEFSKY